MRELVFKQRDRKRTETKILLAVKEVIEQHGLEKLGVNLVADTSGFNKALIYRYFGDINGLVDEYIRFFVETASCFQEIETEPGPLNETVKVGLLRMLADLRTDRHLCLLIKWEALYGKSALRTAYSQKFEEVIQKSENLPADMDIRALIALLCSGIYYLAFTGDSGGGFPGLDLSSEEDWVRVENVIKISLDKLLG